jgi:hypothetical protein
MVLSLGKQAQVHQLNASPEQRVWISQAGPNAFGHQLQPEYYCDKTPLAE